jgi:hypothetical protein
MLEALPSLLPDSSDRADEPQCAPELVEEVHALLDARPLPYGDATLHLINNRAVTSRNPKERWLLVFATNSVFWTSVESQSAKRVIHSWFEQAREQLRGPPDRYGLEATLAQLNYVAAYADRFGMQDQTRKLLSEIVAADGQVPLTLGERGPRAT